MEQQYWTIYCHTHADSGRRYIGLTSQTMMKRWNQHISKSKSSKDGRWHFPNAIRKYGKDAFSHEILEIYDTLEAANLAEEKWINHFDTRDPEKGFNLAKGGEHKPHLIRKNPWDDPEYREKHCLITRNNWNNPEYRAKCHLAIKNRWNDPTWVANNRIACKAALNTPESRMRRSKSSILMWKKEDYINKQLDWIKSERFRQECLSGLIIGAQIFRSRNYCSNGHEFTVENTRMVGKTRMCRMCHRDRCRRARARVANDIVKYEAKLRHAREYMRNKRKGILDS